MKFTKMPVTNIDKILYSYFHDIVFLCDTTDDIKKILKDTKLGFDFNIHQKMVKNGVILSSNDIVIIAHTTCYSIYKDGDMFTFIFTEYEDEYINKCIDHFKFKLRIPKINNLMNRQGAVIHHKKTNLTKMAI